ncbi:MAG TPA: hypothetical protein VHG10_09735 [Glycomyces sp.]|nr:hypothetical protein [Glycomyces sp.]
MLTTEPEGRGQMMTPLNETQSTTPLGVTFETPAVYRHIAPVSASFRGITLPVAGLTTVTSNVNTVDNTDMGAKTLLGRGRAIVGLGWQPVTGSEKRHGVTRGKPPREHRKGLQKPESVPLEAATPATGIAAFLYGKKPGRGPPVEDRRDRLRSN